MLQTTLESVLPVQRHYSVFLAAPEAFSRSQHEMEPVILLPSSPFFSYAKRPLIPHLSAFPDTLIHRYDVLYPSVLIQSIVNRTLGPTGAFRQNPTPARYYPFYINSEVKAVEAINKRVGCRRSYR